MMTTTDEGWYFEGSDPSVGIFGSGWVHEACPVDTDDPGDPTEVEVRTERIDGITVRHHVRVTCPDCHASTPAHWDDWDPAPDVLAESMGE